MKVKWKDLYGNWQEEEVDWVRLALGNQACLAHTKGTRLKVITYQALSFETLPDHQIKAYGETFYEVPA